MNVVEIIMTVLILLVSVGLILVIAAQKNRSEGLGSELGGSAFEGQRGVTSDMRLSSITKVLAIAFAALIIITSIIVFIVK